jgi:hypothetical protein
VPVAEIADVWPGRHSIDGALTGCDILFAHADRDKRKALVESNPQLKGGASGLPNDGQARTVRQ